MAKSDSTGASAPTQPKLTEVQFREIFSRLSDDQQDLIIKILEQLTNKQVDKPEVGDV